MHALQFLEKQFTSIGNIDCHYFRTALQLSLFTSIASVLFGCFVSHCLVAASFANKNSVEIRDLKKPFSEELCSPMGDHTVSFHFPKPQPAVSWPSLCGLLIEILEFPSWTGMDLVSHHVLESLVVSRTEKYLCLDSLSCKWIIQALVSVFLISKFMKLSWYILWSQITENCRIRFLAFQTRHFRSQTLYQVADCHSWGNCMRVYYYIRGDSLVCKRHVFLSEDHTNSSLLTVSWGELVSDLRNSHRAGLYLNDFSSFLVFADHYFVNDAFLIAS